LQVGKLLIQCTYIDVLNFIIAYRRLLPYRRSGRERARSNLHRASRNVSTSKLGISNRRNVSQNYYNLTPNTYKLCRWRICGITSTYIRASSQSGQSATFNISRQVAYPLYHFPVAIVSTNLQDLYAIKYSIIY
jgi:hypothetical protein